MKKVEYETRRAGGEARLVAIERLSAILDQDVDVRLEDGDELLAGRHALAAQHATLGLVDDALRKAEEALELLAESFT